LSNPYFGKSIFPAGFASQGVLNNDPTVWIDVTRPTPIKPNHDFGKVKIGPTQNPLNNERKMIPISAFSLTLMVA